MSESNEKLTVLGSTSNKYEKNVHTSGMCVMEWVLNVGTHFATVTGHVRRFCFNIVWVVWRSGLNVSPIH